MNANHLQKIETERPKNDVIGCDAYRPHRPNPEPLAFEWRTTDLLSPFAITSGPGARGQRWLQSESELRGFTRTSSRLSCRMFSKGKLFPDRSASARVVPPFALSWARSQWKGDRDNAKGGTCVDDAAPRFRSQALGRRAAGVSAPEAPACPLPRTPPPSP